MNQIFNRADQTAKRRRLRAEAPPAERLLWSRLRREALGVKFRRQVSVGVRVVDFYCAPLLLAIEIDGPSHDSEPAADYDAARQESIEALGVRFLRFSNAQVYRRMPEVLEAILVTIAALQVQRAERRGGEAGEIGEAGPLCPSDISPAMRGREGGAARGSGGSGEAGKEEEEEMESSAPGATPYGSREPDGYQAPHSSPAPHASHASRVPNPCGAPHASREPNSCGAPHASRVPNSCGAPHASLPRMAGEMSEGQRGSTRR
jgi:very-short-patch-repair endonuclease